METGLKSRSLPHKRVLITSPDHGPLGKRGLDFRLGGADRAEFQLARRLDCLSAQATAASLGGGQGCRAQPPANGRGSARHSSGCTDCALGLGPRRREQPMKIHSRLQNMDARPGGFAPRDFTGKRITLLPLSLFVSPLKSPTRKTQQTKERAGLLRTPSLLDR